MLIIQRIMGIKKRTPEMEVLSYVLKDSIKTDNAMTNHYHRNKYNTN